MNISELYRKKLRADALHNNNKKRIRNIIRCMGVSVGALCGVLVGAGLMIAAPGPGALLTIGAIASFGGLGTALASNVARIGLEVADKKASKQLQKEFPEYLPQDVKLMERSLIYSADVNRKLVRDIQEAGFKDEPVSEVKAIMERAKAKEAEITRKYAARKEQAQDNDGAER